MRTSFAQVNLLKWYLEMLARWQRASNLGREGFSEIQAAVQMKFAKEEAERLKEILRVRNDFDRSTQEIAMRDYGAGRSLLWGSADKQTTRSVSSIHRTSAIPHWWGSFLFRLVRELKPENVLELGTNLGVSAAYIQSALDLNGNISKLTTIEGDPMLASIAREILRGLSRSHVEVVEGRFEDVLQPVLSTCGKVDLVFIDGHHQYDATIKYFNAIVSNLADSACVVFDDIYLWSRQVRNAWKQIIHQHRDSCAIDFAKIGILFPKR